MNGVDRTKFDRIAAAPYIGRQVRWHDQIGSFRNDAQGGLVWTPDSGANLGSNGIEDITGKLGVSTGQAGGMQYQYDPATGGVISTGLAPPPPPPPPGTVQEPSGPEQQGQPPGPSFPSEEAKSQNAMFSAAFGSRQGDPNFNVNFDYNQDGIINYDDHLQFGQSFTPPPPVDPATQQIDSHVESMISTLGDQRTRYGQAPSEQYYQQYLDGYKTHLQSLSEDQRNDYFAAPHKSYRDYVIDQLDATPELGNILRGKWTGENVNAVAQSIASGQGILNLEYLDSIPEELLSSSNKEHIKGVVNSILNPPPSSTKPADLAAGDPSGEATDLEVGEGDVVSGDVVSGDDLSSQIDALGTLMRTADGKRLGDDYYRNLLTEEGYTPEQVEHILRESRSRATGADTNVDNIFSQMQDGTFDEDAIRAQLLQEGYTPNEVSALIANATTRHEEAEYGVLQDEFSEWLNTQLPLLAQSGDGDTFTKTLMQWKNRGLSEEDLGAANQAWSQQVVRDPGVEDPSVAEGFPPGWVDADNDGFDDNTDLDIDGTPRVFTQEGREQFEGTSTKPAMPDTDDTINDILTYLRDASETQDGIDNIAADDLNQLSASAERAQEQLLEDLNRLGLVGLESGDAQAAIGEFKGEVLAEESRIRRESDERIRDNIDKLIEVAGLEVTEGGQEERIKMLQDSIESRDQLALFNGLMAILGPEGLDLLAGFPEAVVDAVKKGKALWDKIREGSDEAALAAILASEAYKRLRKQGKTDEEAKKIIKEATPEELAELEKPEEPVVEPPPEKPTEYDPTTDPRWEEYGNPPAGSAGEFAQRFDWDNASDEAFNPSFGVYGDPETKVFLENLAGPGGSLTPTEVVEALASRTISENAAIAYFRSHPDFDVDQNNNIGARKGNGWKGKFLNFATVVLTRAGNEVILNGQKHKSQTGEAKVSYSFGIPEEDS